jgi:hypothetical protein
MSTAANKMIQEFQLLHSQFLQKEVDRFVSFLVHVRTDSRLRNGF